MTGCRALPAESLTSAKVPPTPVVNPKRDYSRAITPEGLHLLKNVKCLTLRSKAMAYYESKLNPGARRDGAL